MTTYAPNMQIKLIHNTHTNAFFSNKVIKNPSPNENGDFICQLFHHLYLLLFHQNKGPPIQT